MTLTPEKLAELREKVAALQADEIEYEYRSPWYVARANDFEVRSCRNSWVADADCAEAAAYIAAADPQTVLALVEEVERLRESNAKVTDARDNLLDEVGKLRARVEKLAKYKWAVHIECTDDGYTYDSALAEALRERDELQRKLDNNQINCELSANVAQKAIVQMTKLQARVAELEKNQ